MITHSTTHSSRTARAIDQVTVSSNIPYENPHILGTGEPLHETWCARDDTQYSPLNHYDEDLQFRWDVICPSPPWIPFPATPKSNPKSPAIPCPHTSLKIASQPSNGMGLLLHQREHTKSSWNKSWAYHGKKATKSARKKRTRKKARARKINPKVEGRPPKTPCYVYHVKSTIHAKLDNTPRVSFTRSTFTPDRHRERHEPYKFFMIFFRARYLWVDQMTLSSITHPIPGTCIQFTTLHGLPGRLYCTIHRCMNHRSSLPRGWSGPKVTVVESENEWRHQVDILHRLVSRVLYWTDWI